MAAITPLDAVLVKDILIGKLLVIANFYESVCVHLLYCRIQALTIVQVYLLCTTSLLPATWIVVSQNAYWWRAIWMATSMIGWANDIVYLFHVEHSPTMQSLKEKHKEHGIGHQLYKCPRIVLNLVVLEY